MDERQRQAVEAWLAEHLPVRMLAGVRLQRLPKDTRARAYTVPGGAARWIEIDPAKVPADCPVGLFLTGLHEAGHLVERHARETEWTEGRAWNWARREFQRYAPPGRFRRAYEGAMDLCWSCTLANCSTCQQSDVGFVVEALEPRLPKLARSLEAAAEAWSKDQERVEASVRSPARAKRTWRRRVQAVFRASS